MASRRKRLASLVRDINRLKAFTKSTREEFGELGLAQTSFGADLASGEIFQKINALLEEPGSGSRKKRRRKQLSRLLQTAEGRRFTSQLESGLGNIAENEEKIRARLKGRVTRRSLVRRIQAGRAITRRTGGLGLLGQSGSRRAAAGGV